MPKPWCASFGREAGASADNKRIRRTRKAPRGLPASRKAPVWAALALVFGAGSGGIAGVAPLARAASVSRPAPSPSPAASAEPALPDVSVDLESKGPYKVGDRIGYRLSGDAVPDGAVPIVPPPQDPHKPLEAGYLFRGGVFVPIAAGELSVPALEVRDAQGVAVARTLPFQIKVESNLDPQDPSARKPAPAYGPVRLALPAWARVTGIALGSLLVLALLYFLIRFVLRKIKAARERAAPPKTIDEVALEALQAIESRKLPEQGKFKPYYFGISDTLKRYLGARFEFDAEESTTSEMIDGLRRIAPVPGLNDGTVDRIAELFERMDLYKFTDTVPEGSEPAIHLRQAREVVMQSRKAPELLPAGSGGGKATR